MSRDWWKGFWVAVVATTVGNLAVHAMDVAGYLPWWLGGGK